MSSEKRKIDQAFAGDFERIARENRISDILSDPSSSFLDCFKSIGTLLKKKSNLEQIKLKVDEIRTQLQSNIPESNISPGSKGENVARLQTLLKLLGYLQIDEPTGFYGEKTRESILRFQLDTKIIANRKDTGAGLTGPKTREKLYAVSAVISKMLQDALAKKETQKKTFSTIDQNLAPGDSGPGVSALRSILAVIGYLRNNRTDTDLYSDEVKNAVSRFQIDRGVISDENHKFAGYLGNKTRDLINDIAEALNDPAKYKETVQYYSQFGYLHALEEKYVPETDNPEVLRRLFRINKCERSYVDELRKLNSDLPAMSEKCRISICFPAYHEENNIEKTLEGWIHQVDRQTGKPVDPEKFEILILVNKPNDDATYDKTLEKINAFRKKHPEFKIFPVVHTFNFDRKIFINNKDITKERGVFMGTIYKMVQDLALLRNTERKDKHRVANHLFRSNGADTESRNPEFLSLIDKYFTNDPELDRYRSGSDYPPEAYQKMPLYHVAHRVRQMMNIIYAKDSLRSPIGAPGSSIGLGTYKAALYAQAGGFNMGAQIAEERDLSRRISRIDQKEKTNLVVNAIGNPRRSIMAIKSGVPLYHEYSNFQEAKGVRESDWRKELENLPPSAVLNIPNLERELSAILNGYIRIMVKNKAFTNERDAFDKATRMMRRCFYAFGIGVTPDKKSGKDMKWAEHFNFVYSPDDKRHEVRIKNIDYLNKLIGEYKKKPKDRFAVKRKKSGS